MVDRVGQSLGPYYLVRLLGRSAYAEVYLGEAPSSKTPVAIKVFTVSHTQGELEHRRAAVQTMMRFSHSGLLQIRDGGVLDNQPFLVMDYAPYGSLRTRHPAGTTLDLPTLLATLKPLVATVHFAHAHSLVHGNLKPENVLLGPTHALWLSDFGVVVGAASRPLTSSREGVVYLAPEQLQGQTQFASDQYALGMMVYEWLSGDVPFHGSFEDVVQQHHTAAPTPLRARVPTLSSYVEQVVQRALAKDPASRFASVQAFVEELEQACQSTQAAPSHILATSSHVPLPLIPTVSLSSPVRTRPPAGTPICTYRGHTHVVADVAWSPDGTRLASASRDKTVQVWEATTGTLLFCYLGHGERVNSVAWSSDGKSMASASNDGTIHVWDADAGRLRFIARSRAPHVDVVMWSPDGTRIASTGSRSVEVWNGFNGELLLTLLSHAHGINALAWSPTGTAIITGSNDHLAYIWNAARGDRLLSYPGHAGEVLAVAWSPDGTLLASGSRDHTVQVWEATSMRQRCTYHGHSEQAVSVVAWEPRGHHIASAASESTVHVWDATTGDTVLIYGGHTGRVFNRVNAVAWSPDGTRIASASDDGTVQVWWAPVQSNRGFS